MAELKLAAVESQFADIIWKNEPIASGELAKLCLRELGWKRTTTYTVLKRLCQREIFQNQDGIVTACLSRQAFYGKQGGMLVEEGFGGSLPAFIAAFTQSKPLSREEIEQIRQMIEEAGEV